MNCPPLRPVFLHMSDRHLIWRDTRRSSPGEPLRPITWEIRIGENEVNVRADLDREGSMRDIDFREVRGKINDVLLSVEVAKALGTLHTKRIRRSLYWQRSPDDDCCHLSPPEFDEVHGWLFGTSLPISDSNRHFPLDGPAVRSASNQMYLERREERQWWAYTRRQLDWARSLSFDPDFSAALLVGHACRLRIMHYWRLPECRQLFSSSKQFTTLFCTPGFLPELDNTQNTDWLATVRHLARLPRRALMERLGLPPTRQVVRLFLRIAPRILCENLPLLREAFANPLARKRLSDTTCMIDEMMLRMCQPVEMAVRWPLFRQLCRADDVTRSRLSSVEYHSKFYGDTLIGQFFRRRFRRARCAEDLTRAYRMSNWIRSDWHDLFEPGVADTLTSLTPPLAEGACIRLLNQPLVLISVSMIHELGLEQYLIPFSRGEYALYQMRYQGEFAVAGLRRSENGVWTIDQVLGPAKSEPSLGLRSFVEEWVSQCRLNSSSMNGSH